MLPDAIGKRAAKRRRWPIAAAAAALVAAVIVGVAVWPSGDDPVFTKLTNGCGMVSAATVRQLMTRPYVADDSTPEYPGGRR